MQEDIMSIIICYDIFTDFRLYFLKTVKTPNYFVMLYKCIHFMYLYDCNIVHSKIKKNIKHLIKISHSVDCLICGVIVSVFLSLSNYWICLFATHTHHISAKTLCHLLVYPRLTYILENNSKKQG